MDWKNMNVILKQGEEIYPVLCWYAILIAEHADELEALVMKIEEQWKMELRLNYKEE